MRPPESILIVKLSAIGDVVHTLPFLEVLREKFPYARIDWVVEEEASQIIGGHPDLDAMIVSGRKSWQKRLVRKGGPSLVLRDMAHFFRQLRSREYDLVVDLQGLFKSGLLTALSRGKRKLGMSGAREGGWLFFNERPVPVDYNEHALDRYLRVARHLGCDIHSWKGDIPLERVHRARVEELLEREGLCMDRIIAFNPVARWVTKLWDPERFAALADRIRVHLGCEIVFTGGHRDRPVIEQILSMMREEGTNLAGRTTLKELACLYTRCRALVTTDTGPMHIAAAMGCQVVALFGPTAPWRTGPYGPGHEVITAGTECSPCFKKKCVHMRCMKEITVNDVFYALEKILVK